MLKNGLIDIEKDTLDGIVNINDAKLYDAYSKNIYTDSQLTRKIVSFQGNKKRAFYGLFKYKEAFSASLVQYLIERCSIKNGTVLDPFCGSGTTIFASTSVGLDAIGIELLPIGIFICEIRDVLDRLTDNDLSYIMDITKNKEWLNEDFISLHELRITKDAYPENTKKELSQYISWCKKHSGYMQKLLFFIALSIAEDISYTQKDGQYLRWDVRAEKKQNSGSFQKKGILSFDEALNNKINQIRSDASRLYFFKENPGNKIFLSGSCLEKMQSLDNCSISAIITSPPYCNRYDYTRTYALELALLGCDEKDITSLRQAMLSCTVENKEKTIINTNDQWHHALCSADSCILLQSILQNLDFKLKHKLLNNNGIARMVRGYFYEMACVIYEGYRILSKGAPFIMVNDNVRYAGINVSVDLILSNIAESLGFIIEKILVLPQQKGNSSQQMGMHGRAPLRKCVYIWRKPDA